MIKEYNTAEERNKDIEEMYSNGWILTRLFGDGKIVPLTAVYREK